jgi:hypothetical protein
VVGGRPTVVGAAGFHSCRESGRCWLAASRVGVVRIP